MQNGRKVIPLACAGRKLTGPPEGYDSRKAAQVKDWLQQIPPNAVLEHEVEQKSVLSVKDDDSESQKATNTKLEVERAPSDHTQNEEFRNIEEAELPFYEKKSEDSVSEQEVKPSLDEHNNDSSSALTQEVKSETHAHCWKCGSLLVQLIAERKKNEELEEHLKQQETAFKQSKDEIKKLTNSISEISLRFSEKLIQERESNQTLNSILNKDKLEKEHLQKVRKMVVFEEDSLMFS